MKKAFYVFCTTILGILLAIIILSLVERVYLIQIISSGNGIPDTVNILGLSFFLPLVVVYLILVLGAIGGVLAGFRWWQFVYVDKLYKRLRSPRRIHPFGNIASEKKHRVIKSVKTSKVAKISKTKKVVKKTKVVKVTKPKTKAKPKTKPKKK
jgi:hypothetical protein